MFEIIFMGVIFFCVASIVVLAAVTTHLFIEVKSLQKSTHQVQFVRSGEFEKLNDELKKKLEADIFDNLQ